MDFDLIRQRAISFMQARGWRQLTAKSRSFEQSLFEHALVEMDAFLSMCAILQQPSHHGLSNQEIMVVLAALLAHDAGKERPEWQAYILGHGASLSDVDRALTQQVVPEVCAALELAEFDDGLRHVLENCINLHMRHERRTANVLESVLQGSGRWWTLAEIVYHLDNLCSIKGIHAARDYLERSPLGKHLHVAHHHLVIRGVSTTMLHRAARESFDSKGWEALLHYSDATLYIRSSTKPAVLPTQEEIVEKLAAVLEGATSEEVTQFIVGSPTANILPKPELFDYEETRSYLDAASRKIRRLAFAKKKEDDRRKVIAKYLDCKPPELDMDILAHQTDRFTHGQPEMIVFKFFKAMMSPALVGDDGTNQAQAAYDVVFGPGAWEKLQATSTLNPERDMANTVDLFWRLPGERFDRPVATVEELAPESRTELLIDTLARVAEAIYAALPSPPTRATLARSMAEAFLTDLVSPAETLDPVGLARQQRDFYGNSKPFAGKEPPKRREIRYFCPLCNVPFTIGTKAAADFIDKPESHTNRGISHGSFGYVMVCNTCKYERILRQLLLKQRASEIIVLFPRMNIGDAAGEALLHKANTLYDRAYTLMMGEHDDPDTQVSLALTGMIARKGINRNLFDMTAEELADVFSYRASEENQRKHRRELEKRLKEEYSDEVGGANEEWGTAFASWAEAVDAVIANQVEESGVKTIRREVFNLVPRLKLVAQTPNMLLLPVTYPLTMKDDSETNAALRKIFVELLLGLSLDVSVAIVQDSDLIDFRGGEGVAWVPPIGNARRLIDELIHRLAHRRARRDTAQLARLPDTAWISLEYAQDIFRAIGAAALVADATNYSKRAHLFSVLTAPTAGHVLRRIEQQCEANNKPFPMSAFAHLQTLQEVLA